MFGAARQYGRVGAGYGKKVSRAFITSAESSKRVRKHQTTKQQAVSVANPIEDFSLSHDSLVKFLSGPLQLYLVADTIRYSLELARQRYGDEAVEALDFNLKIRVPACKCATATMTTTTTSSQDNINTHSTMASGPDSTEATTLETCGTTTSAAEKTHSCSVTYIDVTSSTHPEHEDLVAPITPLCDPTTTYSATARLAPDSHMADLCDMLAALHTQLSTYSTTRANMANPTAVAQLDIAPEADSSSSGSSAASTPPDSSTASRPLTPEATTDDLGYTAFSYDDLFVLLDEDSKVSESSVCCSPAAPVPLNSLARGNTLTVSEVLVCDSHTISDAASIYVSIPLSPKQQASCVEVKQHCVGVSQSDDTTSCWGSQDVGPYARRSAVSKACVGDLEFDAMSWQWSLGQTAWCGQPHIAAAETATAAPLSVVAAHSINHTAIHIISRLHNVVRSVRSSVRNLYHRDGMPGSASWQPQDVARLSE